jgi:hypothetical protein
MKLPGNLGNLDWSEWTLGLWSAVITGGSAAVVNAIGLVVIDPKDFSAGEGKLWALAGNMFLWAGFMGMLNFLRTKPAPGVKTVEKTTETTLVKGQPAQVVTTEKETVVQPVETKPAPKKENAN